MATAPNQHPWTLNAKDFLSQVTPYMQRKTKDHMTGGSEGGDFVKGGDDVNAWHQGAVDEGMTLTLADGRKWVPAGGDAGVTFHPATSETEAYYTVTGDASNLDPSAKGGNQRVTVNYRQVGDEMVPMGEPTVEGYKHGFYAQNKGLVNWAATAAAMGYAMSPGTPGTPVAPATGAELSPLAPQTIAPGASTVANVTAGTDAAGKIALATANGPLPMAELMATTGLTEAEIVSAGGVTSGSVAGAAGLSGPAVKSVQEGTSFAELAKKYGPTVAKTLLGAGVVSQIGKSSSPLALANSALGDPAADVMRINSEMEKDYNDIFKPWMGNQVEQITARGNAGYDQLMGLSKAPNKNIDDYQAYLDRIGSQGYRDQQRGSAMGEVQQQSDSALGQQRRSAMARGIDPSKFALQSTSAGMQAAGNKAFAAQGAENDAWDQWGKGTQAAAGLRIADGNYRSGLVKSANDVGQSGFNAGVKAIGVDGMYRGGLSTSYGNLYGAQTARNTSNANIANQQTQNDNALWRGLGGIAGTWAGSDSGSKTISNLFGGL